MAQAARNTLNSDQVIRLMVASLPLNSSPILNDVYAAIALCGHACMLSVGFRLVGLGEDHKIEAASNPDEPQPLPSDWNSHSTYAFRYKHTRSSMEYLLKVSRLGAKAVIFGIALGDDRTASFDIAVRDYLSESAFPFQYTTASPSDLPKLLQDLFISPSRIRDLSSLFNINIILKLAPGLGKADQDFEETQPQRELEEERRRRPETGFLREDLVPEPARPYPFDDPLAIAPRRPVPTGDFPPPGFEDEFEMNRPPRGQPPGYGGRRPLNIGERDLYPPGLGPYDPLGGPLGPGGFPRGGGGGGMHPTFDDPLFGGGQGEFYDPRAPPGARYDPVGPGDGPPNLRGGPHFPGGPRGGFGGSGGGFRGGFGGGFGGGDII